MMTARLLHPWRALIGAAFALLLASCFEADDQFVLNPDGSGKVVHECVFQPVNLMGDGSEGTEEEMKNEVIEILEKAKGVDAWKDVSFSRLDDGRIKFKGTAYFSDISEFKIENQSMLQFSWDPDTRELRLSMNAQARDDEPEDLTEEEKLAKLKVERGKYQQSKPMLTAMLGNLTHEVRFMLPGKVVASRNFQKADDGRLGMTFEGAKMIEVIETLMNDDEWMMAHGFNQQEGPQFDAKMSGLLFGEEGPAMVKLDGTGKPLFDFKAELMAAKAETAKLQEELGATRILPPAAGEALKSVRLVGVRLVSEVEPQLELRPFNYDEGLTLSVLAELSGSALDVTDRSKVLDATADDGSSLVKGDSDWDRRISFPRLSKDKGTVLFEVSLKRPTAGMKTVKKVSGILEYRTAKSTKEVELGLESFEEGAKGTALSAEIRSVEDFDRAEGSQRFTLKLKVKPDDVIGTFLVAKGERLEVKQRGWSSSDGGTSFNLEAPVALPDADSIVVEMHADLETFEVPFQLEDIVLPSLPAAE